MSNSDFAPLCKKRSTIKSNVTKLIKFFTENPDADIHDVEPRKDKLEQYQEQFRKIQDDIYTICLSITEEELRKSSEKSFDSENEKFEDQYFKCTRLISQRMHTLSRANVIPANVTTPQGSNIPSSSNQVVQTIKVQQSNSLLPQIEIKPFDGNLLHWRAFRNTFESLVHNAPEIPVAHKFQLLKNSLCGDIVTIIDDCQGSEEDYKVAWELVVDRCEKPRKIINSHLQAIFDLPALKKESPASLRSLRENAQKHVNSLKLLNESVDTWDSWLVYVVSQKLDMVTRRAWERTLEDSDKPLFKDFMKFISKQERGVEFERSNNFQCPATQSNVQHSNKGKSNHSQAFVGTQHQFQCNYCNKQHSIYSCNEFLSLNPHERSKAIKSRELCMNCLRGKHPIDKCRLSGCRTCQRKHNTLLHFTNTPKEGQGEPSQANSSNVPSNSEHALTAYRDSEILLGRARVKILDRNNIERECIVLLDSASQSNFITEKLASLLQLPREKLDIPFSGLGMSPAPVSYKVRTKIRSRINNCEADVEFVALPVITGILPSRPIDRTKLAIPSNIRLADPEFDKPSQIDGLIGVTLYDKLVGGAKIRLPEHPDITLRKTSLGWIISGEIETRQYRSNSRTCHLITSLESQVERFWKIEEMPVQRFLSSDEKKCEQLFVETTTRDADGRYIVKLPFNNMKESIGDSYNIALKRFYALERKFSRDPKLKQEYIDAISEYFRLGHVIDITERDNKQEGYYIPHQPVLNEDNLTTKLRIVFDASAASSTGVSLNDALLVGPTIQQDLVCIIIRFRIPLVVVAADVRKMYRQVKIHGDDVIFQKILWRENPDEPIRVLLLLTVTQGTSPANFLATRSVYQLADDEKEDFPEASQILKEDSYVDDILSGADSIKKALDIKRQLNGLLNRGGFELHKWTSNKKELIDGEHQVESQDIFREETKKLLGIQWHPSSDSITYAVGALENTRATKRTILSEVSQLFDPLGLLGPVIVLGKIIIQDLWKAKVHWDETIPTELQYRWTKLRNELALLNQFQVPRRVVLSDFVDLQLHGFCDASNHAYGACVYLRSSNRARDTSVQLICAKSRVAPLKSLSIDRLELCGALLLAKLAKHVQVALGINFQQVRFWSDSTIALHWIKSSPHILKSFVANRVSEIQSITDPATWCHIDGTENPADFISRGQLPSLFISNELWSKGPSWLVHDESEWKTLKLSNVEIPEVKFKVALTSIQSSRNEIFERFSSFPALIRFVAFCRRAEVNRKTENKIKGEYSVQELRDAEMRIIKIIQAYHFGKEIFDLTQGQELFKKSTLICLDPFLDDDGIVRVGGRLANCSMSYARKYPVVLPRNGHITKLIIRHHHEKNWHAGVQATLNAVRHQYWPINGKNLTRLTIYNCVRCRKLSPRIPNYTMGILPEKRVSPSRVFENVGIDYCGHFFLKEKKFRNKQKIKGYVVVFVCFSTKAVHLELVTDLTTETCLESIKRFISRRGKPRNIYTDNGTNFVGSKNEILKLQELLGSGDHNAKISRSLHAEGISWHFSPPKSPHFGGLWEAAVKSFKRHLYRTVGENLFTYEQFNTIIVVIESILNSRPLTPLSSDPNDLSVLTPAHFIIGDSFLNIPEYNYENTPVNRLSMWQRVQKIKQSFWKRWSKEYLNELRVRSKWHKGDGDEIKPGMLVTIKEDDLAPMHWCVGRVIDVHPGGDNVVRVATVKTPNGVYKRTVKKLSPLPIDIE